MLRIEVNSILCERGFLHCRRWQQILSI